jgi:hypothetical protein
MNYVSLPANPESLPILFRLSFIMGKLAHSPTWHFLKPFGMRNRPLTHLNLC